MSDTHDLVGAYCTDALDAQERRDFEAHLSSCASCRAEAAGFREVLGALAEAAAVHPPAALEDTVVARALGEATPRRAPVSAAAPTATTTPGPDAGMPTAGPAEADEPPLDLGRRGVTHQRGAAARVGSWLAVAAAGAVLFASGIAVGRSQEPAAPTTLASAGMSDVIAVASAADAHVHDVDIMGTTSRLVMSDEMGKTAFLAGDLPMPAKGMCYQVWRVTEDGQMVSAGTFTPDADGHIAAVLDGDPADAEKFMITMEPPGGSDHPTGELLGEVEA